MGLNFKVLLSEFAQIGKNSVWRYAERMYNFKV
jgi:hypothetical protein